MGIPFRQPIPFPQPRSLRRAPQSFDYQAHIRLPHGQGVTGVAFGLCNGHGYALTMDTAASCLYFMEIQEGMLLDRGMRRLPVKPGQTCPVRVTYGEGILRLWLNENPLDTEPWPKFEFALDLPGGEIGFFGNGELADESLLAWQPEPVHGETFQNPVRIGADPDILIDQKPHIGTDVLSGIIKRMREHIIEKGGRYIFNARFDEIRSENGHVTHAGYTDTVRGTKSYIRCSELIVAAGHSARDTFAMLLKAGLRAEPKPFAVGIRVQHPQEAIDAALYGERDLKRKEAILGPASYKLTHRTVKGRSCYSFCMCPGGYVVNSSSEEGRLCINGMSYNSRASGTANSAVIVNVLPEDYRDYGEDPVLSGIEFQRRLEELAYKAGGGVIPYETFGEFKRGESSPSGVSSFPFEFLGYAASGDLRSVLPEFVSEAIIESMPAFAGVIKGFDDEDTIVAGVEARTSSPVRILRDEKLQSDIRGIFPAGEGAGYAGGITSAAADGIRTAMYIVDSIYGDQDNGNKR